MRLFKSLAAAASIALIASPIAASADPASSLSLNSAARASTSVDEANEQVGASSVYKVALVAAAGAIGYLFLDGVGAFDDDEDESPASP